MSHEITRTDSLVLANGKPAWHGLGTVVQDAPSPEDALELAGLTWTVERLPLIGTRTTDDGVQSIDVPSHVANVRSDTGDVLGVVGQGYQVLQNVRLAQLVREVADAAGVTVESAGSLRGGRLVWFLAHLDTFTIGEKDTTHQYALFLNGHDGSCAIRVLPTDVRVVCNNTKRAALDRAELSKLVLRVPHTGNLEASIEAMVDTLSGVKVATMREQHAARELAGATMTSDERDAFFADVWTKLYGEIPTDPQTRGDRTKRGRAVKAVATWKRTVASEQRALDSEPTAWLAANAVTNWIDHERTARGDRTASNLVGKAADDKVKVFTAAALATA